MVLLVLDTSVILKWFTEETHSDVAVKLRNEFYRGIHGIVEPDLMIYEFANALNYNPNYTAEDVKKAIDSLVELQIDVMAPTIRLLKDASEIAKKHDITVYDAVFVALAKSIGAVFVTADKKLHNRIKELGFARFIADFK